MEFGTSFGISTLYLAAAVRDTIAASGGTGRVITTELDPSKCTRAGAHFEEAGLSDLIEIREGDALETLQSLPDSVDMALIDG